MHKIFIRPKTDVGRDAYRGRMPVFDMGNGSVMRLFPGRSEVITDSQLAAIAPQLSAHADRVQVVALSPAPLSLVTERSEAPTLEPASLLAPPTDDVAIPSDADVAVDAEADVAAEGLAQTQELKSPDIGDEEPVRTQDSNDEEPAEEAADTSATKRRGRRSRAARG